MSERRTTFRLIATGVVALAFCAPSAQAYIGPGAGFAAAGSVFVLLGTFLMAFGIILIWPFKAVWRLVTPVKLKPAKAKRVIVIGFDGFDPGLAREYGKQGLLPNLTKLERDGCFHELATACPSISPVAWSTYATGVDASRHNIYDFLTRDPCSYAPVLSSSETGTLPRTLNLGLAEIPIGRRAFYRLLQKSQPFWKLLGESRVWSSIIRVPITFPPQPFRNGTLLSGMCVPDLQGTQGSFAFYSTRERAKDKRIGGQQFVVVLRNGRIESNLIGPPGKDGQSLRCKFSVEVPESGKVKLTLGRETVEVGIKEYTPWLKADFAGISGIVRFYVQTWEKGCFELYATPVQIDPEAPAMPISQPFVYSIYLAKLLGPFGTLGLAEDTWALNERVIDEQAFLDQAWLYFEERKKQLWDVLAHTQRGFATVVFDTSDRISHMFWRTLDKSHPANAGKEFERWTSVIPETYKRMDDLVGEVRSKLGDDPDTVLMVISDHGFTNFRRGVNLNTWLRDEGYLVLKDGAETSGDWFEKVDWSKTRAFTLGLTGLFINRIGREKQGIVAPGPELEALCKELKRKLEALRDPQDGAPVIKEAFLTRAMHSGPYADAAPELLIGYHRGYRHSWECATGSVTKDVIGDNTRSWSGDHCVDPRLVPGVFWCNRKIENSSPALIDMAPSVLDLFGVEVPAYMQGRALFESAARVVRT